MQTPIQLSLFDSEALIQAPESVKLSNDIDNYAFLYTATEKGNATGIRFMMSQKDAKAWCESPLSCGILHGTRWAYFWTSVRKYIEEYGEGSDAQNGRISLILDNFSDNGQWDTKIESLGLRAYKGDEITTILKPCGIDVKEIKASRRLH